MEATGSDESKPERSPHFPSLETLEEVEKLGRYIGERGLSGFRAGALMEDVPVIDFIDFYSKEGQHFGRLWVEARVGQHTSAALRFLEQFRLGGFSVITTGSGENASMSLGVFACLPTMAFLVGNSSEEPREPVETTHPFVFLPLVTLYPREGETLSRVALEFQELGEK